MKATINGITYEGTLEEIKAIADHMTTRVEGKTLKQGIWSLGESLRLLEESEQRMLRSTGVHEMKLKPYCQCVAACSCSITSTW